MAKGLGHMPSCLTWPHGEKDICLAHFIFILCSACGFTAVSSVFHTSNLMNIPFMPGFVLGVGNAMLPPRNSEFNSKDKQGNTVIDT